MDKILIKNHKKISSVTNLMLYAQNDSVHKVKYYCRMHHRVHRSSCIKIRILETRAEEIFFCDHIEILRTLQSYRSVGLAERVDRRAHVPAEVPFFQGIDSEIHLPGVVAQRVLRHCVFVIAQQLLA